MLVYVQAFAHELQQQKNTEIITSAQTFTVLLVGRWQTPPIVGMPRGDAYAALR